MTRKIRGRILLGAAAWIAAVPANALRNDLVHTRLTPGVYSPASPQPVLLEVTVGPGITRVVFRQNPGITPAERELRDDGTLGDRAAGDRIYSVIVPVSDILANLVQGAPEVTLGTIDLRNDAVPVVQGACTLKVLTNAMTVGPVTAVNSRFQLTPRVANLKVTRNEFLAEAQSVSWAPSRFFGTFRDSFDFVNLVFEGAAYENRSHTNTRNATTGIGLSVFDNTAQYGSGGRLLGINRFPNDHAFDLVSEGNWFLRETAHQWINYIPVAPLASGSPHWPLSDLAFGIIGVSNPANTQGTPLPGLRLQPQNNGYLVVADSNPVQFNDLELYLMGLVPPGAVSSHFVFNDQSQTANARLGGTLAGPVTPISIGDITSVLGGRVPDSSAARKDFPMATILVTFDRFATAEEMAWFEFGASRADSVFQRATGGRGRMSADIAGALIDGATGGPVITSPTSGQTIAVSGVTFQWAPVSGAGGYGMRITQNGSQVFAGSLTGGASSSTLVSLADGTYVFQVRSCAGGFADSDCGPYSQVVFSVALTRPGVAPSIVSPAAGQTFTSSTQTFRWSAVDGAGSYEVLLRDMAAGGATELSIANFGAGGGPPPVSTVFTMRGSANYQLQVRACAAGCGPWSAPVTFAVIIPAAPTAAPGAPSCTLSAGSQITCQWSAVVNADQYDLQAIQLSAGPGGGALTVAGRVVTGLGASLDVPAGAIGVIVRGCNGNGCGPFSPHTALNPPGPNPAAPILGSPSGGLAVTGPDVFFSWTRVPGDTGQNTIYRLYVQDLSRGAAALDILTTSNFWAAKFTGAGNRYDAQVIANPSSASPIFGPAAGFLVRGGVPPTPTMTQPRHQADGVGFAIPQGNVQLGWTPLTGASLYEYYVAIAGTSAPSARGVTPGLLVQVPLTANIAGTTYTGIVRACPAGVQCVPGSDAGWGSWSNAAGGAGVTTFRLN